MAYVKTVVENLAARLAARRQGRVTANLLAPHLPVSLDMIEEHLDAMTDGTVVVASEDDGLRCWDFPEYYDADPAAPREPVCAGCGGDLREKVFGRMCPACRDGFEAEILDLAETTGWPARAVWQHELLYITAAAEGPVRVADVASRSRLTLSQVKDLLREMVSRKWARLEVRTAERAARYVFPPVAYPREAFLANDAVMRRHPSSLKEEWEIKIIRSLAGVVLIFGGAFLLAFARVPLRLSIPLALFASVLHVAAVARRRLPAEPRQMGASAPR